MTATLFRAMVTMIIRMGTMDLDLGPYEAMVAILWQLGTVVMMPPILIRGRQ